jgi:hypothetical protein
VAATATLASRPDLHIRSDRGGSLAYVGRSQDDLEEITVAHRVRSRLLALIGVVASALLLVAGCGAAGSGAPGPASAGQDPSVTRDAALAALVPAGVAAGGTVLVGTDASHAPNEFTPTPTDRRSSAWTWSWPRRSPGSWG